MQRVFTHLFILLSLFSFNIWANDGVLKRAYNNQQSDLQVKGSGKVTRILADDNKGSRHQKFLLQLKSSQTILIAHNIDLAPRINSLKVGDTVQFYGEYEWNSIRWHYPLDP